MNASLQLGNILTQGAFKIHLIGVAGSGMSGIAGLLLSLGHHVSGSDLVSSVEVQRLIKLGLVFYGEQSAETIQDAELIIYSSAIKPGNGAYDEAKRRELPMFRRAEALAAILNLRKPIVVAGTHGKTTTSSMSAHVLREGGVHPSHYVGAEIPILGTNAHWDPEGEYFVAEGDESDGTLRLYTPAYAIVLNIEAEHLDYYKDMAAIEKVFRQFLEQTSERIIYCLDDPHARRICSEFESAISFGLNPEAEYSARNIEMRDLSSVFEVFHRDVSLGTIVLGIPGRHNVSNSLGVIALAHQLEIPFSKIADALARFHGAKRRFEEKYHSDRFRIIDDYGHHPTEIRATVATARQACKQALHVLFQPHRYSRTHALRDAFGQAFDGVDFLYVTSIYAASEAPLPGVSGETILEAAEEFGFAGEKGYFPDFTLLRQEVARRLKPGDMVLTLGAGNIHEVGGRLAQDLARADELMSMIVRGEVKLYESLSRHTTLRVGGPAQFWVEPETEEGFARVVRFCQAEGIPLMVMGRGSNLLVRDGGIPGVVVHLARGEFRKTEVDGQHIRVGVGVKMREVAYAARDAGMGGFEWFEGIPGNVGGGLRMNAGAMGSQTFDHVVSMRYIDKQGIICEKSREEIEVHYRSTPMLEEQYALSAVLTGVPDAERKGIDEKLLESRMKRKHTQPAAASAGCIFKNPAVCGAGKLIDDLGLKNYKVGNARVSDIHANFIVNDGDAKAEDVLQLIEVIKTTAREKRGIELETEVQIVGESQPIL